MEAFNSIVWIPIELHLGGSTIRVYGLSIPLYGFRDAYLDCLSRKIRQTFNSIVWIRGSRIFTAAKNHLLPFNSIVWILSIRDIQSSCGREPPFNSIVWIHQILVGRLVPGEDFQFHCMDSAPSCFMFTVEISFISIVWILFH